MMNTNELTIPLRRVFQTWWPLAASWLLMGLEGPSISAVIARLVEPEINLAAYGGIVFPLALIIEAPVIMLLAASTALSRDLFAYRRIFNFMMWTGALMTVLHMLVALTPLYYWVANSLLGAPAEIIEPGRVGLILMTPWTWAIGYRRFQQGVMIRFGHSRAVGVGTLVRLLSLAAALTTGYLAKWPGIVVGAAATSAAVTAEAVYAGWRVRPILRGPLAAEPQGEPLAWKTFFNFYTPLALTSLMTLIWNPLGAAAMSRMPLPLESLAVWPVAGGLLFMLRSFGNAYNEVVVALLGKPGSLRPLTRFTGFLVGTSSFLHLFIAITPLAYLWFRYVTGLNPALVEIAQAGFWLALLVTPLTVLVSWYQGAILYSGQTHAVPESVFVSLATLLAVLGTGVVLSRWTGLFVGMTAMSLATLTQAIWLLIRSRRVFLEVRQRDQAT